MLPCVDQAVSLTVTLPAVGLALVYGSDRVTGRAVAPKADVTSEGLGGWTLNVHHVYDNRSDVLLEGGGVRRPVGELSITSGAYSGDAAIASADGRQIFLFDHSGQHVRTFDGLTGATLWTFEHDSAGRLVHARDQSGNTTTFLRDSHGALTGITFAGGAQAAVSLDGAGYLSRLVLPGGPTHQFTSDKSGLLLSHTDPDGGTTHYAYGPGGLLTGVVLPGGATQALARTTSKGGDTITVTSSSGRHVIYTTSSSGGVVRRTITDSTGGSEQESISATRRQAVLFDGTAVSVQIGPDPRFGMQAPVIFKETVTTPKGLTQTIEENRQAENGLSVPPGGQVTETVRVDGHASTTTFDPGTRTVTFIDPTGVHSTALLDASGRIIKSTVAGVPTQVTYDGMGRPTAITTGIGSQQRTSFATYADAAGIVNIVDPAGSPTTFAYDVAGRPQQLTFGDGTSEFLLVDPANRVIGVQPPGQGQNVLTYSRRGLLTAELPANGGAGLGFTYDDDGLISAIDGATLQRDGAGRLVGVKDGNVALSAAFQGGSTVPSMLLGPGGVQLDRGLDGSLVTSEAWKGPVLGTVGINRDDQGRPISVSIDGVSSPITYDAAGRLTKSGDLVLAYSPSTGQLTTESMAALSTRLAYDGEGAAASIAVSAGGSPAAAWMFTRDADGRVTLANETLGGVKQTLVYTYDKRGRLVGEANGGVSTTYAYDASGNLLAITAAATRTILTYNSVDQLLTQGTESFNYGPGGALLSRQGPEGKTLYSYDSRGVLTSVALPDGHRVDYLTDAIGRRIGKNVDGSRVVGYLWAGDELVAELDASGALVARFAYDAAGRPAEMQRGGNNYALLTDPNGSVRLVVDSATGAIAERIDYDAFGNVLADSQPGFQPFGFAGGLSDVDTGLVRIGQRDYDPRTRRWTAPDPVRFAAGSTNVYTYVDDDPINLQDPSGLYGSAAVGTGGVTVSATGTIGPLGSTFGVNFQNIGGHWSTYIFSGPAVGAELNVSVTGNIGNILSPSGNPAADWAGATNTVSGGAGIFSGGYYQSPNFGNGQPSYNGVNLGLSFGAPAGFSATRTTATCVRGCGESGGDPHIFSADGLHFNYQGAGEFLALTSTTTHDLDVQVRQQAVSSHSGPEVAFNTAVAANVDGDRVGVYPYDPAHPEKPQLYVNGNAVNPNGTIRLAHGGQVVSRAGTVILSWPDSTTMTVVDSSGILEVGFSLAAARKGTVTGLWGAYAGDANRDLVTRQGQVISPPTNGVAPSLFSESWRIGQAESLFDDMLGRDVSYFTNKAFGMTPVTVDDLNKPAVQRATGICEQAGLTGTVAADCTLDLAASGDPAFVSSAVIAAAGRPTVVDHFDVAIGDTVSPDQPTPGAGVINNDAQRQTYSFLADGTRNLYISVDSCQGKPAFLVTDPDGVVIAASSGCSDLGRVTLAKPGQYQLIATATGTTATFALTLHAAPPDQHFSIALGDRITQGQPSPGAGSLDSLGARQLYDFTLAAPQVVFLEHSGTCDAHLSYALVRSDAVNGSHGRLSLCDDWGRAALTAGAWTIEVISNDRTTGGFGFSVLAVPADRHFAISLPTTIGPGSPPGAGHIDGPGQRELFDFSGKPGQVVHIRHTASCGAIQQIEYRVGAANDLANPSGYLNLCLDLGAVTLPAGGSYTVEVQAGADTGDFGFNIS